jgi:hypothetical protein
VPISPYATGTLAGGGTQLPLCLRSGDSAERASCSLATSRSVALLDAGSKMIRVPSRSFIPDFRLAQ